MSILAAIILGIGLFVLGVIAGALIAGKRYADELQNLHDSVARDMVNLDEMLAEKSPLYRNYLNNKISVRH